MPVSSLRGRWEALSRDGSPSPKPGPSVPSSVAGRAASRTVSVPFRKDKPTTRVITADQDDGPQVNPPSGSSPSGVELANGLRPRVVSPRFPLVRSLVCRRSTEHESILRATFHPRHRLRIPSPQTVDRNPFPHPRNRRRRCARPRWRQRPRTRPQGSPTPRPGYRPRWLPLRTYPLPLKPTFLPRQSNLPQAHPEPTDPANSPSENQVRQDCRHQSRRHPHRHLPLGQPNHRGSQQRRRPSQSRRMSRRWAPPCQARQLARTRRRQAWLPSDPCLEGRQRRRPRRRLRSRRLRPSRGPHPSHRPCRPPTPHLCRPPAQPSPVSPLLNQNSRHSRSVVRQYHGDRQRRVWSRGQPLLGRHPGRHRWRRRRQTRQRSSLALRKRLGTLFRRSWTRRRSCLLPPSCRPSHRDRNRKYPRDRSRRHPPSHPRRMAFPTVPEKCALNRLFRQGNRPRLAQVPRAQQREGHPQIRDRRLRSLTTDPSLIGRRPQHLLAFLRAQRRSLPHGVVWILTWISVLTCPRHRPLLPRTPLDWIGRLRLRRTAEAVGARVGRRPRSRLHRGSSCLIWTTATGLRHLPFGRRPSPSTLTCRHQRGAGRQTWSRRTS